jgi:(2R)-3-sulfolactate dehydrogenase (NADP+)
MPTRNMTLTEIEDLAFRALKGAGTRPESAASLARAVAAAERDGTQSHGLMYVPIYCEHVQCGKVIGTAVPVLDTPATSSIVVDAGSGFAHPAIDAGFESLVPLAKEAGIAALSVRNSYNCGALGYHVERLAEHGLVGLGFTNAPASIAPIGGAMPVIGTNPFALGVPDGNGGVAFVIDQSASAIAKSEVMMRAKTGKPIPIGWALDSEGNPTTDPEVGLGGSMVPSGGYKGFGVGLMVETFAAAIAGATLGKDASPFSGTAGGPPRTGQYFIAIEPNIFSGGVFDARMSGLTQAITEQPGTRLPGSRRRSNRPRHDREGVAVDEDLLERIEAFKTGPDK